MSGESNQEIESKFYVQSLDRIQQQLEDRQAELVQPRVLESNLRFDRPDGSLRASRQVLRLRQDTETRLTYKGPSALSSGVLSRREIEFTVESFERAQALLEALEFEPHFLYEKYRSIFEVQDCLVMLDELPYGNFVEIEGQTVADVQRVAAELQLNPKVAVLASYHALFEQLRQARQFPFHDLTFANFTGLTCSPAELGVSPADT